MPGREEPKKGDMCGIATKKNKDLCDKLNKALNDLKRAGIPENL